MTDKTPETLDGTPPPGLLNLPEAERLRLGEALRELLAAGSISGLEPSRSALYHWCRQYFDWLREATELAGLEVALLHEERLVQAVPQFASLRLKLRQDATLVWLALWYAGDVRWRDEGQDQAFQPGARSGTLSLSMSLSFATANVSGTPSTRRKVSKSRCSCAGGSGLRNQL